MSTNFHTDIDNTTSIRTYRLRFETNDKSKFDIMQDMARKCIDNKENTMFNFNNKLLMSLQPQWIHRIALGRKSIEVRKTRPKRLQLPFQMFMYCTKDMSYPMCWTDTPDVQLIRAHTINKPCLNFNGRIVGSNLVTKILEFRWNEQHNRYDISEEDLAATCLTQEQLLAYGKKETLYGYVLGVGHIYKETIPLDRAFIYNKNNDKVAVKSAPQSWGYVGGIDFEGFNL